MVILDRADVSIVEGSYDTQYPLHLSMKNIEPLTLRAGSVIILRDNTSLEYRGVCGNQLVFLIGEVTPEGYINSTRQMEYVVFDLLIENIGVFTIQDEKGNLTVVSTVEQEA